VRPARLDWSKQSFAVDALGAADGPPSMQTDRHGINWHSSMLRPPKVSSSASIHSLRQDPAHQATGTRVNDALGTAKPILDPPLADQYGPGKSV
jgi:hypothetical protein